MRFEDLAVGDRVPELARLVTREDVKAYADASGDQNPLHQDEAFARAAGFPAIVAHGMFTMGHLASCIVAWLGEGGALRRMQVQLRSPVLVGDTIVAGGVVKELDGNTRTAIVDVWVRVDRANSTDWPIRRSEAEVTLV